MTLALVGCSSFSNDLTEPPAIKIIASSGTYDTILGTYCWEVKTNQSECVDKAGPLELVKEQQAIEVEKGEKLQFVLDESLRPKTVFLTEILKDKDKDKDKDVLLNEDYSFIAPTIVGEYIYGLTGNWQLKENGKSSGDAQYVFKITVK